MKYLNKWLLCLMLTCVTGYAIAGEISESQVKKLIDQMDSAIETKSVEQIADTLSDTVTIKMNIHANGNLLQTLKMTKSEYISLVKQGWDAASSYSYVRNNEKINISGEVATVTAEVVEVAVIQGQTIKTRTQETAIIEMVDGAPLVTKITGDAHM